MCLDGFKLSTFLQQKIYNSYLLIRNPSSRFLDAAISISPKLLEKASHNPGSENLLKAAHDMYTLMDFFCIQ